MGWYTLWASEKDGASYAYWLSQCVLGMVRARYGLGIGSVWVRYRFGRRWYGLRQREAQSIEWALQVWDPKCAEMV